MFVGKGWLNMKSLLFCMNILHGPSNGNLEVIGVVGLVCGKNKELKFRYFEFNGTMD